MYPASDTALVEKLNVKITIKVLDETGVSALGTATKALRDGKGTDIIIIRVFSHTNGMGFLPLPDIFILCQQIQNAKCKERNRRFPVSAFLGLSLSLPVFFWFSPCILLSGKQS